MNGGPVIFKSKLQRNVALSSARSTVCSKSAVSTKATTGKMNYEQIEATIVHEDNQSAIAVAKNAGYQARAKHVDNKHKRSPCKQRG